MKTKLALATLVFTLFVGLLLDQHPAQAWWNTTAVNVYGWAYVPRDGLQVGYAAKYVELYDGSGNWISKSYCRWGDGRWYVNGVRVNGNYRAVAWAYTSSGWKSATTWKYIYKPSGIPRDIEFPNLEIPFF